MSIVCTCCLQAVGQQSAELGELRALAEERLKETEVLSQQIVQLRVEVEDAREESRSRLAMTGEQALASTAYLSLQTQFSVVQQGGWGLPVGCGGQPLLCMMSS